MDGSIGRRGSIGWFVLVLETGGLGAFDLFFYEKNRMRPVCFVDGLSKESKYSMDRKKERNVNRRKPNCGFR